MFECFDKIKKKNTNTMSAKSKKINIFVVFQTCVLFESSQMIIIQKFKYYKLTKMILFACLQTKFEMIRRKEFFLLKNNSFDLKIIRKKFKYENKRDTMTNCI